MLVKVFNFFNRSEEEVVILALSDLGVEWWVVFKNGNCIFLVWY